MSTLLFTYIKQLRLKVFELKLEEEAHVWEINFKHVFNKILGRKKNILIFLRQKLDFISRIDSMYKNEEY